MADRTILNARNFKIFFTAKSRFFKGNRETGPLVGALHRSLMRGSGGSPEECIKDIPEPTKVHAFEAPASGGFHPGLSVAVVSSPLILIGKYFVGRIYFFESLTCGLFMVMIRVIFKSQFTESLLYIFIGSIPVDA